MWGVFWNSVQEEVWAQSILEQSGGKWRRIGGDGAVGEEAGRLGRHREGFVGGRREQAGWSSGGEAPPMPLTKRRHHDQCL